MDADGLPLVGPGVDLSKVGAIHPKRMLAFLNHFVSHTTRFLNRFSCVCEQKLSDLNLRIQHLETTMNLLEAKLASIPWLEDVDTSQVITAIADDEPSSSGTTTLPALPAAETPGVTEPSASAVITVSQDKRYAKFFKMINMGVPAAALRQKARLEGLNPDLLDTPDAPAPPITSQQSGDTDFSDDEVDQGSTDDSADFSD
ncbi:WASH complex subunit 3-like [Anneissia japonica]|uniref:WASH complex subunit 3-like n=1 Tax=Anneissia japonica TaxID=1529436 RepID=UPI001425A08D|nr:WASH complex subunit 3-like [Anneissia japonica]